MDKTHILSVWVENRFGVLAKVSGLFASRGYNIKSLSVGETEDPTISRMTIVVQGDDKILEQVKKQLNKLIDTIKVIDFVDKKSVVKELCFFKVNTRGKERTEIIVIANAYNARIIDIGIKAVSIEISDSCEKVNDLIKILSPFGIIELVRSGVIAIAEDEK